MRLLIPPLVLVMMLSMFVGCVEVKDENEAPSPTVPASEEPRLPAVEAEYVEPLEDLPPLDNLSVDQPLYLYRGDVLTEAQFRALPWEVSDLAEKDVYEYRFNEINFTAEGALYTLGATVRIFANSLNSQNGEIATFPPNSVAPDQQPGRGGGHIILKAEQASGILQITLRGEKGGAGAPGPEPTELLKGAPGEPAKQTNCFVEGDYENKIGGPGKPGKKGGDGFAGGRGGNSGRLDLVVTKSLEFYPGVSKEPGKGGDPGVGGEGGVQGDIGHTPCVPLFNLIPINDRPRGDRGNPGPPAPSGSEEYARIEVEGHQIPQ